MLDRGDDSAQVRRFVERFCRPHGLDRPAAPLVAAAIEELARLGPAPRRPRLAVDTLALRTALYPVAASLSAAAALRQWGRRVQGLLTGVRLGSGPAESLDSNG